MKFAARAASSGGGGDEHACREQELTGQAAAEEQKKEANSGKYYFFLSEYFVVAADSVDHHGWMSTARGRAASKLTRVAPDPLVLDRGDHCGSLEALHIVRNLRFEVILVGGAGHCERSCVRLVGRAGPVLAGECRELDGGPGRGGLAVCGCGQVHGTGIYNSNER